MASRLASGHALPEVRGEVLGPVAKADATAVRSVVEGSEAMTPEERARHAAGMRCLCVVGECGGCITCRVADEIRAAEDEQRAPMPCGHPLACVVSSDEGTNFCGACEREARAVEGEREGCIQVGDVVLNGENNGRACSAIRAYQILIRARGET